MAEEPAWFNSLQEIREQGVVMQEWENSCAAASLATVLTFGFYDPVSEQQIALDMLSNTSPNKVRTRGGFSMLDMKNYLVRRGYQADVFQDLSLEQLSVLKAPIVIIENMGVPHFVVFDQLSQGQVSLADPAFGNRQIPAEAFQQIWRRGIALWINRK
ncbi:C39 family peptidase [Limnohabitans sp. Jir72]|uniref:C39 family peptidase n=1 Tax=Limnohabitans sp. Jir72 TaxID=1977909 RepID=UPI001304D086|nr:cysteine peptidase family C39 domain-containing protein [Limnohabitans sp. Jir72]